MKKYAIMVFIILISLSAAGCVSIIKGTFGPAPTMTPTVAPTTVPTTTATIAPSATAAKFPGYTSYPATNSALYQPMQNGVKAEWAKYYRTDDWKLDKVPSDIKDSHYGVVLELNFYNPTSQNQTVSYVYFKAGYTETLDYPNEFINSKTAFYDETEPNSDNGFFYQFTLRPNEARTVWMYSIISDSDFEKYNGYIKMNGLTMNYDSGLIDP